MGQASAPGRVWASAPQAVGLVVLALCLAPSGSPAQTRRQPAKPPARQQITPVVTCRSLLGIGVTTKRSFCDVLTGRDPAGGVLIEIPPHRGTATLSFALHNRHTYSEEQIQANKGYAQYTATIGILTMDNTLLTRAVVQSEFRTARDLVDRISGGAGPGGMKAVAPTGEELITFELAQNVDKVSLLGERLLVVRPDGRDTFVAPDRPIAIVSNVTVQYVPAPPPRPARRTTAPATPRAR